jgi:DNA repair protein RadA/Sms
MKTKNIFVCSQCGYEASKWYGKCPSCNEWNSMQEHLSTAPVKPAKRKFAQIGDVSAPMPIGAIDLTHEEENRLNTGMAELNTVLGGGLVVGSMVLVGGDPGIGKSTLLLQICQQLGQNKNIMYVSGEESIRQIKMRAQRLSINASGIHIVTQTNICDILNIVPAHQSNVVIIDSIQTMYHPDLSSAPGSVSQVRECAMQLMQLAKNTGITVILVGHVTKDGSIAGPRVLEHMVDCVLYFEGEQHLTYRILRAVKNRFGSTNEIGVFEMTGNGLMEVFNPSMTLLSGRPQGVSGTCIACVMEGSRPILAEIQTLITPTAFGIPRRMCTGFEYNRAAMILAVLEKRCGLKLNNQDVYVNITGGLRLDDPAADMALALSVASSYKDIPLGDDFIAMGEIGLAGEIRNIPNGEKRIAEGKKLGFKKMLVPSSSVSEDLSYPDMEIYKPKNVLQAMSLLL